MKSANESNTSRIERKPFSVPPDDVAFGGAEAGLIGLYKLRETLIITIELKKSSVEGTGSLFIVLSETGSVDFGDSSITCGFGAVRFGATFCVSFIITLAAEAGRRVTFIMIVPSNEGTTSSSLLTSNQTRYNIYRGKHTPCFLEGTFKPKVIGSRNRK